MSVVKLGIVLGIVATVLLVSLWILDLVPGQEAREMLTRAIGVIAVITLGCVVIDLVTQRKKRG